MRRFSPYEVSGPQWHTEDVGQATSMLMLLLLLPSRVFIAVVRFGCCPPYLFDRASSPPFGVHLLADAP